MSALTPYGDGFNRFLEENFMGVMINCDTSNLAEALTHADLVVIGEKHREIDRKMHNVVIQQILTDNTGILVEDSCDNLFIPQEGLPGQLQFIDPSLVSSLHVHGWDNPCIAGVHEAFDYFISTLEKIEKREEEAHVNLLRGINTNFKVSKYADRIFEMKEKTLRFKLNHVFTLRELHLSQLRCALQNWEEIRNTIVFSKEGMKMRTHSLGASVAKATECYGKVIVVGGQMHFCPDHSELKKHPGLKKEVANCFKKLYPLLRNKKVVVLFTRPDLVEQNQSEVNIPGVEKMDAYIKARSRRKGIESKLLDILNSGLPTLEKEEMLKKFKKEYSPSTALALLKKGPDVDRPLGG